MLSWKLALGCLIGLGLAVCGLFIEHNFFGQSPHQATMALLNRADTLAWNNQWIAAQPLYLEAETRLTHQNRQAEALYAHVSQYIPRAEREPIAPLLRDLQLLLRTPDGQMPATKLRILAIEGMIATNYDASMARTIWKQVEENAGQQRQYRLMMRAEGEQGIAAFLLGDLSNAKRLVTHAWFAAKYFNDPAAHVRYASVYGTGLVELQRYEEAIKVLDEAIRTAKQSEGVAYPSIAINSKIDALRGLHRYQEALALATQAIHELPSDQLDAHLFQIDTTKGRIFEDQGQWDQAIAQYESGLGYARKLGYWRGIVQTGGLIARAYEHKGDYKTALISIDEAIDANSHLPEELYFMPGNLAAKAQILQALKRAKEARALYEQSTQLIDALLVTAPTPNVERLLIAQLGGVYTGYYENLSENGNFPDAFNVIERERGRIEAEALRDHAITRSPERSVQEKKISSLNLQLLRTVDANARATLSEALYDVETQMESSFGRAAVFQPIALRSVGSHLREDEMILEYVLDDPSSSVIVITSTQVRRYVLPAKRLLDSQISAYRNSIIRKSADQLLGQTLFNELLRSIPEYSQKTQVIVVPDEGLHLLPFAALVDHGNFALQDHSFSVAPSTTVLCLLRERERESPHGDLQYVGVAAWTNEDEAVLRPLNRFPTSPPEPFRALPQSEEEVTTIAQHFPVAHTLLLGPSATETRFKNLPLLQYRVLHLALHGYADIEFPDRSALVFAPEPDGPDDGLLEVREARELHLNARLVTLSACNTGVGPVGESDVANLANAFIEAGAESVVSSLWSLDDNTTSQLMKRFYAELGNNITKAEALRQAQLSLQHNGLPPYYWASVELVGDPSGTL